MDLDNNCCTVLLLSLHGRKIFTRKTSSLILHFEFENLVHVTIIRGYVDSILGWIIKFELRSTIDGKYRGKFLFRINRNKNFIKLYSQRQM